MPLSLWPRRPAENVVHSRAADKDEGEMSDGGPEALAIPRY